jgi:hypothetical protein
LINFDVCGVQPPMKEIAMAMQIVQFTLPAGAALSEPVDCAGSAVERIVMPNDWTGNAALTFQMSCDGASYHDLYRVIPDAMINYEVTVPLVRPKSAITVPPSMGAGVQWLKIRSGTRAAPVVQEADRIFQLVLES